MPAAAVASWTCPPARSSLRLRAVAAAIRRRSLTPWSSPPPSGQHVKPCRSSSRPPSSPSSGNSSRAGGLAPEPPRSPRRTGRSRQLNQQQVTPSASSLPSSFPCSPSYLSPIVSSSGTASMYPPWPPQAPERTRQPHLQERIPHSRIWAFPASPTHTRTYTSSHAQASFCGARVGHAPPWIQRGSPLFFRSFGFRSVRRNGLPCLKSRFHQIDA